VRITDINDNTPIFDISEYVDSTVWKEDSKVGTTIIKGILDYCLSNSTL